MSNCKRTAPTIASMSKKRKTSIASSCEQLHLPSSSADHVHHLPNSNYPLPNLPHITISPPASLNSAGTVLSGEFSSDRSPLSCCSSSGQFVKENNTMPLDLELQTKGPFEPVDSTFHNFKSFSRRDRQYLLSEFSGDSEESTIFPAKSSAAVKTPTENTPLEEEIEEFFAAAEKYEQKRFAEKYNFDIAKDMPLEGRYQWVRFH